MGHQAPCTRSSPAAARAHVCTTPRHDSTPHTCAPVPRGHRAQGRIIEPLKDYHKDEVRELGIKLGLPQHLVWRQPFPGPGLAIRTLCATEPYLTPEYDITAAQLDAECARYPELQLAPTLLPVRTVGVQGDGRSYAYLAALSSDTSPDGKWEALFHLAKEIPGHVHNVNRIVYVLGPAIKQVPQAHRLRYQRPRPILQGVHARRLRVA